MAASMVRGIVRNSFSDVFLLARHQANPVYNLTPAMYLKSQPYDPRHKQRRKEKYMFIPKEARDMKRKMDPTTAEGKKNLLEENSKKWIKADNEPFRQFNAARPVAIHETYEIFDPYVPTEGDGKVSLLKKQGLKDVGTDVKKAGARMQAARKIRKKGESDFNAKEVAPVLQDIYLEALSLLNDFKKNKSKLQDLCTSKAYDLLTGDLKRKTLRWEFVETVQPPKVVHVTCNETVKDIYFAQVTVRIFTVQKLSIYDQFGRLMFGSPHLERDVLEFAVFEKNIVDLYGKWRLHDRIIPEWMDQDYKHVSVKLDNSPEPDAE